MSVSRQLADALAKAGISQTPVECVPLTGGCIHDVSRVSFKDRAAVVCKCSLEHLGLAQLQAEAVSLRSLLGLSGQPLRIPEILGSPEDSGTGVLILEWLEPGSPSDSMWIQFGRDLARMHELSAGRRYGFEEANFIGATPQLNEWHDDWIEFNQVCRFEPQIRQARDAGVLNADEAQRIGSTVASIGQFLPAHPHPAMLHGDLWSGNLMPLDDGVIAVIDPACSIGDGWADLAMMKLFGGIPSCCFDAYAEARVSDDSPEPERIVVYQLYHLINHVNLFGRGYLGQVMQIVESLG